MPYFTWFCCLLVMKLVHSAYQDMEQRRTHYTIPLKAMLGAVVVLKTEILTTNDKKSWNFNGSDEDFVREISNVLARGAVLERNLLMNGVRKNLSRVGYVFSLFLKEKGLTYEELYEKYRGKYPMGEVDEVIIAAACRANPGLVKKLVTKLTASLRLPETVGERLLARFEPTESSETFAPSNDNILEFIGANLHHRL